MKRIFVGCSSRNIGNTDYDRVADGIGEWIGANGHEFIFGGCGEGLMGRIYRKVSEHGGVVHATQAAVYQDELVGLDIKDENKHVIDTINQRKDFYAQLADVLVYIPGGIGTLDELISGIETRRSGEHKNPIVIVNVNNFFGPVFEMLDKIYDEGLATRETTEKLYYVAGTLEDAIKKLAEICS